eukprot:2658318-Rhodomonas_salina.4
MSGTDIGVVGALVCPGCDGDVLAPPPLLAYAAMPAYASCLLCLSMLLPVSMYDVSRPPPHAISRCYLFLCYVSPFDLPLRVLSQGFSPSHPALSLVILSGP